MRVSFRILGDDIFYSELGMDLGIRGDGRGVLYDNLKVKVIFMFRLVRNFRLFIRWKLRYC